MLAHRWSLTLSVGLSVASASQSQNLVPNSSFEVFTMNCTSAAAAAYGYLEDWDYIMCSTPPGLMHACNNALNNGSGVPQNALGYQNAHSGDAYAVISTLLVHSQGPAEDGNPQKYANVDLIEPLAADRLYCVRLWMNMADSSCYRTGAFHAFIGYGVPNVCNYQDTAWDTHASVTWDISTVDTSEWSLLEGEFVANGGETNLTLGAFQFEDEIDSTFIADYSGLTEGVLTSKYFIDDVEVWACSVGWNEQRGQNAPSVYPNPATEHVTIQLPMASGKARVELLGADGRLVMGHLVSEGSIKLNVAQLPQGQYILRVLTGDRVFVDKIVIVR